MSDNMKVKVDVKLDEWLYALRHGDYAKGGGALVARRDSAPDEFCCLGVLADLGGVLDDTGAVAYGDVPDLKSTAYIGDGVEGKDFTLTYQQMVGLAQVNDNADSFDPVASTISHFIPRRDDLDA